MKHKWIAYKDPNTPNDFGEWVVYCDDCGMEQDDDNKESECVDEEPAKG